MATANERLFHANNTHQIGIIRVSRVKEREIERHFTEAQRAIIADVFENDHIFTGTRTGVKKRALERIIARNQSKYTRSIANFRRDLIESLQEFGEEEVEYNEEIYKEIVNIEPVGGFKPPTANDILASALAGTIFTRNLISEEEVKALPQYRRLNTVQKRQLVGGLFTTQSWFQNLEARTRSNIANTIIQGYEDSLGPSAVARNLRRGVAGTTRRGAEGIVRTAYTHVANVARLEFYNSLGQRIRLRYNAVLDERTSDICSNLDGLEWWNDDPELREPPQHFRCRSDLIPVLQGDEVLGDRTYVARVRGESLNFNQMARERYERGNKSWSDLGKRDRNRLIGEARKRWSRENIGTVPAGTNYRQWFNMQSDAFKRGVLGKTRFELYQKGGLKYEDFSDSQIGRRFNLNELRQMNRSAFVRSGLIPESES